MLRYAQHDKALPVPIDPSHYYLLIQLERHYRDGKNAPRRRRGRGDPTVDGREPSARPRLLHPAHLSTMSPVYTPPREGAGG
jgi:hypothetical protein